MRYQPIPIALLAVGQPLPVDVWSPQGQLLLRKGQPIVSERHREKLYEYEASATVEEAQAWQRAYERMVYSMWQEGASVEEIARAPMPMAILRRDYMTGVQLKGGWLDLQEVLRGLLYRGGLALNPLPRLAGIETKARELLEANPDDSLFCLFQALADDTIGYCATNALLCAAICELVGAKMGLPLGVRHSLFAAALTMNIGMAREQDYLAKQGTAPTTEQRQLIMDHPTLSEEILLGFGVDDPDELDIVRWHHYPDSPDAQPRSLTCRHILHMADVFVAKMASRTTREALAPIEAAKSIFLKNEGQETAAISAAMASVVGFFPPGSYVRLANEEIAVVARRGARANTPWVISIVDRTGMPILIYDCKDTTKPGNAIAAPLPAHKCKVMVNVDKMRRARDRALAAT